jgi:sec-independent protein translocase protein TatC
MSDSAKAEASKRPEGTPTVEGSRMPITEHLAELARRMKRSLYFFIVAFAVVSSLPDPFHPFGGPTSLFGYNFLIFTLLDAEEKRVAPTYQFITTTVTGPITVFLNISLVLALVISIPYMFNQMYGFVAPGLYQRERKAVRKYVLPFSLLFATGGVFGLLVVFPIVMRILLAFFKPLSIANLLPLNDFVNLLMLVPVVTGLAFTFPVIVLPLVELKVLSVKQLSSARKWVYVLVALGVGLINPDPTFISSIPIIVPIYVLYEITVYIAKRIERNRALQTIPKQANA